jgi:Rieske 2Fe-2S family protein
MDPPPTTLPGRDYTSQEVFDLERERIFHRGWYYIGRSDPITAGDRLVVDVAGESVLVVRDRDGHLRAHANVCRHRGARLCDESGPGARGSITCPYHAWSYAMDGRLIATPNVAPDDLDRDALSLWSIAVDEWEGFAFVSLAPSPPPLLDWLIGQDDPPTRFIKYGLGALRVGRRTVSDVAANWKILIDNYLECLHCPRVHPELVDIVPAYRSGDVIDARRKDGGVDLLPGSTSFSLTGRSTLPLLPAMPVEDASSYFGNTVFPNMFIDVTGTCVVATTLHPRGPAHTTVIGEYLFAPETIAAADFEPSDVVDFNELVARQDYAVCEMVQRGVGSRAFTGGTLSPKDRLVVDMQRRYLIERGDDQDS